MRREQCQGRILTRIRFSCMHVQLRLRIPENSIVGIDFENEIHTAWQPKKKKIIAIRYKGPEPNTELADYNYYDSSSS